MIQRTTSIDPNRIGKEYGRVRKEAERKREREKKGRKKDPIRRENDIRRKHSECIAFATRQTGNR